MILGQLTYCEAVHHDAPSQCIDSAMFHQELPPTCVSISVAEHLANYYRKGIAFSCRLNVTPFLE